MELKQKLNKPYTEKQRLDFIVEFNHNNGYEIKETESAIEAYGKTEAEQIQEERERLNMLSLTAADVERAIYKAKGMDFDDVIELLKDAPSIDIKALKIELKANNFFRGNPYINTVGALLGFSEAELDYLFENKELPNNDNNSNI